MKYIKLFSMVLLALATMSFVKSSIVKTKTLNEQFTVNPESHFKVRNDCGPIVFKNTDDAEARVEATIKVEGKTEEEIAKVLDQFKIDVDIAGNVIDVKADNNVDNWIKYNGLFFSKNEMTFNDGSKAEDIDDTDISLIIYLPKVKELTINNKYDEVIFESFNCDVNASLISSNMTGGAINGNINIDLKYGELNIGDVQDGELVLFDSEVEFGNGGDMDIRTKYSSLKYGDVNGLDLQSFDDDVVFQHVKGDLEINAKYSKVNFEDFAIGNMMLFDSDVEAGKGTSIVVNSKYSSFVFKDVGKVELQSFDDDFLFGAVQNLKVTDSKYSDYKVKKISKKLTVLSSFDDDINVTQVGEELSKLFLDSKYTDLTFPMPSSVAYHLEASLNYCSFDYATASGVESKVEKGESLELVCKVNNPTNEGTKVEIKAYSGDIDIQ